MRIATSTVYESQTNSIDNLVAQQQQLGQTLSSGKQLNAPSDNPTQIAQDLELRSSIAAEKQGSSNITNASSQLSSVDGALSTLTDIMQKARGIAVEAGGGFSNSTQQQSLASQVDSLLQEAVSVANTKYAGKYVFAGTAAPFTPPVTPNGQPVTSVTFNGNSSGQTEQLYNGEAVNTSVTLQQAFNYNASDGSPDVFQTLINLRNTIANGSVVSESASRVNNTNTALISTTALNATGPILTAPLTFDNSSAAPNRNASIQIATQQGSANITFTESDTINTVLTKINAQTATTGVTASFDYKQQRLILASSVGAFSVTDVASAGATNTGNFVEAFDLQSQANLVTNVSRQLGDVDNVMQGLLTTRATIGGTLQTLSALGSSTDSQVVNDTKVQSGIEDADIAKVISQFSQTQTALQAAYGTTTRLESKTLFDYLQ